jgi:hypothetical protein
MLTTSIKRGLAGVVAAGGMLLGNGCYTAGLPYVDSYFGGGYVEEEVIIIEETYYDSYYDDGYYDDGFGFGLDLWW